MHSWGIFSKSLKPCDSNCTVFLCKFSTPTASFSVTWLIGAINILINFPLLVPFHLKFKWSFGSLVLEADTRHRLRAVTNLTRLKILITIHLLACCLSSFSLSNPPVEQANTEKCAAARPRTPSPQQWTNTHMPCDFKPCWQNNLQKKHLFIYLCILKKKKKQLIKKMPGLKKTHSSTLSKCVCSWNSWRHTHTKTRILHIHRNPLLTTSICAW